MTEQQGKENSNNIDRLKAIRGDHRGVVTKLSNEAFNYLDKDQLAETTVNRLEIIDHQLATKLKVLEDINEQILSLLNVEDIEYEIEESENILAKILECRKRIDNRLQRKFESQEQSSSSQNLLQSSQVQLQQLQASQVQEPSQVPEVVGAQNNNTIPSPTVSPARTRLPKLSLPKFKGNITNWKTFWDSFQSAIHNNKDISDIDKFNYLNSLLEGTAACYIKGLTISEANYKSAIEILTERFGKPQLISAHMDELMKLQSRQND